MIEIDPKIIAAFSKAVEAAQNIVIVPHTNPDGDAIGAALGLWMVLEEMDKTATVIMPNGFPEFLEWIEGSEQTVNFEESKTQAQQLLAKADLMICVDFNDPKRADELGNEIEAFTEKKLMIDHHPNPSLEWDLMLSYPEVSSTCQLLYLVLKLAGYESMINTAAAEAIFTGMMTDTGNFSYNASSPEIYETISALLKKGIDKDKIHSNVFHTFSEDRWRLIGYSLSEKMVILPEFSTGYISLSKEELDRFNFQPGDTEGLVNYPLNIKGIVFAVLIMEKDDKVKLSFRSKGNFATNTFSNNHFGGGGHRNAAGGESELNLDETIAKFVALLPEYKSELFDA